MLRIKTVGLRRVQVSWRAIFQYAFILCVILNFRSILVYAASLANFNRIVKLLMGLSVAGCVLVKRTFSLQKIRKCIAVIVCVVLYWSVLFLTDSLKRSSMFTLLIQLLAIIVYCLLIEDSVQDTMHKYTNIVLVIAVVSLLLWVFGSLLGIIHSTGTLCSTWTGNDSLKKFASYYNIYFERQSSTFFGLTEGKIVRNAAIFTEAPMASMIFAVAFLNECLMCDKLNWKRCAILAVAVISTISTTGTTVLIIAAGLRYVFSKTKTKGSRAFKLILLPTLVAVVLVALVFLVEQKLGTSSGSTRVDDFIAGYKAWMDAPLFGNGYGNSASYERYMSSFRSNNQGFSNSLMQVLAYGGIYLFLPYFVAAMKGILRLAGKRQWHRAAFYLVFLYAFLITICPFQMLTFYLFVSMVRGEDAGK